MQGPVCEFVDCAYGPKAKSYNRDEQAERGPNGLGAEIPHQSSAGTHERRDVYCSCSDDQERDEEGTGVPPAFPEVHDCSFRTSCRKISRKPSGAILVMVAPLLDRPAITSSASLATTYR